MSEGPVVIAVDLGSGGVRAAAVDNHGVVLAQRQTGCATLAGTDGSAVHRTEEVWRAAVSSVREVAARIRPDAVVFGGTAHALVTGTLEAPDPRIVLWSDGRSTSAHRRLVASGFFAGYSAVTGCPSHPAYWPAKLAWLRDTGELSPTRNQLFSEKDLILYRLTGATVCDTSTAGATGLLDTRTLDWSRDLLERLGARWLQLPAVRPSTAQLSLSAAGGTELGLPSGTPVVLGGVDGPLAHLGVCGTDSGAASVTVGTSLGVRMHAASPVVDDRGRCWSYSLTPDHWIVGGAGSNGGNLVTWLRDVVFCGSVPVEEIIGNALARPSDPELVFLPYLNGERAPLWRADLAGGFVGLRARHTSWDLARAVLDAVGCMVYELSRAVSEIVSEPTLAGLNGGFTASRAWAQLVTDAMGCPGGLPSSDAAVVRGAAALARASLTGTPLRLAADDLDDRLLPDAAAHRTIRAAASRLATLRGRLMPDPDKEYSSDPLS